MAKIEFSFNCPACGKPIRGVRGEKEYKKFFECKKCTRKFSLVFDRLSRQELERAFLDDKLPPDIIFRASRPLENSFPFDILMKGKKHG